MKHSTKRIVLLGTGLLGLIAAGFVTSIFAGIPDNGPLAADVRADKVVIDKGERRLRLLRDGETLKTYRIALGFNPHGPKQREGDGRTPEGSYVIDWRNPQSTSHLSLHVSYPDANDRQRAKANGVHPGGDIMIHGLGASMAAVGKAHALKDWTAGCIAVTNGEMDEIWRAVPDGTPIDITP